MVGPLKLLKILHCKRMCQNSAHKRPPGGQKGYSFTKNTTFNDENNFEDCKMVKSESKEELQLVCQELQICRVCLKKGDIPIYGNDFHEDISDALTTFGNIDVQSDDLYPKHLCESCISLLQSAILFRKTAQHSDQLLRHPLKPISMLMLEKDVPPLPPETNNEESTTFPELTTKGDESDSNEEIPNNMDDDTTYVDKHLKEENKTYHCKKCDLDFNNFTELAEHRLSQEHENMRQTCPVCNNSYTSMYFKKHLALHKIDSPFMCDICGKQFIVQGQFARHRLIHSYDLPFKCSLCPYRGRFTESLKMHMRSHTGEKPYQCTQCAARFVNKSNLNKHVLTHTGQHSYKCEACGRGFYTKRELDLHVKVDHTGIRDHVCNVCGKAFGYRKQMMKHQLKVHKREKLRSGRTPLYLQLEKRKQSDSVMAET